MRKRNLKLLIKLMEYVQELESKTNQKLFNMMSFQSGDITHNTKEALIKDCGTTCCIAGWLAMCPAFMDQGVHMNHAGQPRYKSREVVPSLKKLFGLNHNQMTSIFYDYSIRDTTGAIERIKEILAGKYQHESRGWLY